MHHVVLTVHSMLVAAGPNPLTGQFQPGSTTSQLGTSANANDFWKQIGVLWNSYVAPLVVLIFVGMALWRGIQFASSGGNAQKHEMAGIAARNWFIGALFAGFSWVFTSVFLSVGSNSNSMAPAAQHMARMAWSSFFPPRA